MDNNWDEDEEGYEGPDGYVDEPEFDVEDQMVQDDPDVTGEAMDEAEDDDGLNAQRQSIFEMLDCEQL